ncbi:MAG: helix-turn-helix transcriptional regulator [Armatimonadetes bacterium]|nr:helix-turn-helix transcriptional regulator [Armatimonadota bacterium]
MPRAGERHAHKRAEQLIKILAAARAKRGLSQREVSRMLDLHPATIGKIERGERNLTITEFFSICACLDMPPVDVLKQI